jgi:hypothetical protein
MATNGTLPEAGADHRPAVRSGSFRLVRDRIRKGLRFDPDLERQFVDDYYEKSIFTVRIALVLGVVLYSVFGILDFL